MREYRVVKIIKKPKKEVLRIGLVTIDYWAVAVVLRGNGEEYESTVTFESMEKAQKLEIGDVFLR